MTVMAAQGVSRTTETRRRALLDAAIEVFARFGYRKTSMDDVARAAGVSRQGLYLHFADKEDLFRATVQHGLRAHLAAAVAALADETQSLESRLVTAFDEWLGRRIGMAGAGASDLIESSGALAGTILSEHGARFDKAVAHAISTSPLMAVYARAKLTPMHLARTLHATARGLKHSSASREEFTASVAIAARMLCAPRPPAAGRTGSSTCRG